jgi:hypothetical protein
MDHEKQLLAAGVLQVCPRTLLVLDETAMTEGKLNETGVKNMRSIQQVLGGQILSYDFQYHMMDFETDIMPIVVSQGRSMFDVSQSSFFFFFFLSVCTREFVFMFRAFACIPL